MSLYHFAVPTITRALEALKEFVQKGEQWADEKGVPHSKILEHKFADDMKPFIFQIQTATDMAKSMLFRVGGEEKVSFEDNEKTFAELYARIDKTVALLNTSKPEKFLEPSKEIEMTLGPMDLKWPALHYVQFFILPNIFFHTTTAYDLLRNVGVPIGKGDFLGTQTFRDAVVRRN